MRTDLVYLGRRVYLTGGGYPTITVGKWPNTSRILVHRDVMEKHLGMPIPAGAEVHHVDGNKLNWDLSNLWLLSEKDHVRIHAEQAITALGGDPKIHSVCSKCKQLKLKSAFRTDRSRWNGCTAYCTECHAENMRRYREKHPERSREANLKLYRKTVADPVKRAELLRKQREYYAIPENKAKVLARQKRKRLEKKLSNS